MSKPTIASKRSKKYCLVIDQSDNGAWLKFATKPSNYASRVMMNLALLVLLNSLSAIIVQTRLPLEMRAKIVTGAIAFFLSSLLLRRPPIESLVVYRNYGVQVTTVRGFLLLPDQLNIKWLAQSQFIPRDEIVDIVINEGFCRGFQVIFYLAVIIRDSKKLKLLFPVCIKRIKLKFPRLLLTLDRPQDLAWMTKKSFIICLESVFSSTRSAFIARAVC